MAPAGYDWEDRQSDREQLVDSVRIHGLDSGLSHLDRSCRYHYLSRLCALIYGSTADAVALSRRHQVSPLSVLARLVFSLAYLQLQAHYQCICLGRVPVDFLTRNPRMSSSPPTIEALSVFIYSTSTMHHSRTSGARLGHCNLGRLAWGLIALCCCSVAALLR